MRKQLLLTAVAALIATSGSMYTQEPDNTKRNKDKQHTADDAKNNTSDVETMRQIRKAVVDDSSLSTYAHNVKIIARNGKVTLRGPVRSEAEKASVEAKAKAVAGDMNVTNQLTIKPEKQ
jgi:osmotically-inducible protein OsmY